MATSGIMRVKGMCVGKMTVKYVPLVCLFWVFSINPAFAAGCDCGGQTCSENEYCREYSEIEDMGNGINEEYYYMCEPCPSGKVPNDMCNACVTPAQYCQGYNDNCPFGNPDGKKCKKVDGCPSPCQKYEMCNTANGEIIIQISGSCHEEGSSCLSDTRACSQFNVNVVGGTGDWTCKKTDQTGNASWNHSSNKWDVSGCQCTKNSIVANGCDSGHVKHTPLSQVDTATSSIIYIQNERYCMHCAAGTVPKIASANENIIGDDSGLLNLFNFFDSLRVWFTSNYNGDWGVWQCENVKKPYYSPGCDINFNENYDSACQKSCDQYLETKSDGATNADACKPDGTEYTDGIGTFTLGTDSCSN